MPRRLVLVKHAQPVLEESKPPREWVLGREGEAQAPVLAAALRRFVPLQIVSSREPKAFRTAELIAAALGVQFSPVAGLEEFDRPALPLVSQDDHERLNARIFEDDTVKVLGRESASGALDTVPVRARW